ncbi:MAG: hemolysin family protein [Trueperaceae bacterium]|nr:hemolysin family protein [Trueperaceae bacterium]
MDNDPPSRSRPRTFPFVLALFALTAPLLALAQPVSDAAGGVSAAQVATLVILLLLSGLMSGSETALTALGEWKIRQLREDGLDPTGVFALLEMQPTRFITTLLIGNNLVNIAATALVTQMSINLSRQLGFAESLAVGYATGVMTLLVLIFGEITPKSIAVHNAVGFSRLVIRPVWMLSVVLYPVGRFFAWITTWILRGLRLEPTASPLITENELRLMLRSAEESGVIEAQEEKMIKGIIDLEETVVREVMTPRVDVVAISEDAPLDQLLDLVIEHGFSRLPVYAGSIDDVHGLVYARDLLPFLGRPDAMAETRIGDLMGPPQYVPETLSVLSLLRDMRLRKLHMAVVVDEFGGTSGLITLEDIIEEITGEIYDETDEDEGEDVVLEDDGSYLVQGAAHLEEVAEVLRVTFEDDGEFDTLAGFLINAFGYIPQVGESIDVQHVNFQVVDADERRVLGVRAVLHDADAFESHTAASDESDERIPGGARYGPE